MRKLLLLLPALALASCSGGDVLKFNRPFEMLCGDLVWSLDPGLTDREGNGRQPVVFTCSAVSVVSVDDCVLFQRMAQDSRFTHVVRQSVGLHPRCKALGVPNGNHLSKRCTTKLIHSELLQKGQSCWTLHA